MFDIHKTKMIRLSCGEKNYNNILSHVHTILEHSGQTDRWTDWIATSISCISAL